MGKSFKDEFTFEKRLEESQDNFAKYPLRIPGVAAFRTHCNPQIPGVETLLYLVPRDMSVGQFIHILSSRLHLTPGKALLVFVKGTLPQTAALMDSV
ncbi:hypothetical protein POTOM_046815 [Populus tomentosa]|uniref:Autophagy-related protein n=1 Tax=Populus tomentosa TaxID=118781 RepID=A0A8X7YIS9_POPTO|nr:hypothetical protein POTOM_046815 [Populus tomentosa]